MNKLVPTFTFSWNERTYINISTGVIGNESINCHMSQELDTKGLLRIIDRS